MAEPPDELEGWRVRWDVAVLGSIAYFAFVGLSLTVAFVFWRAEDSPQVQTWPSQTFAAPRLNAKLDRDPTWSFAPPDPLERPPSPAVAAAMRSVASDGEAAFGAPAGSRGAMSPEPVAGAPP